MGYPHLVMPREETVQIRHHSVELDAVAVGLETAKLLFAHLEPGSAEAQHADRAREIYDRIRKLASDGEATATSERARADTMAAPAFKPGESGAATKVPRPG